MPIFDDHGTRQLELELSVENRGRVEVDDASLRGKFQLPRTEELYEGGPAKISSDNTLNDIFLDFNLQSHSSPASRSVTVYPRKSESYIHAYLAWILRAEGAFVVDLQGAKRFIKWTARMSDEFEFTNNLLNEFDSGPDFHFRVFFELSGRTPSGNPVSHESAFEVMIRGLGASNWDAHTCERYVRRYYASKIKRFLRRIMPEPMED